MTFSFRPAKRENVGLLIGLAGGTGSGKTYSALELATGISGDKPFAVIDTEARRALHYADRYRFDHGDLRSPFRPAAYIESIVAADAAGYPVIVVDSMSHEHAGEGGLLDWHDEILDRMAGDDYRKREACNMRAWVDPKMDHKRMVQRLLQVRAHVILCFRAEEKIEIAKVDGKTVIRPKESVIGVDGWMPVCEKNLPYELTSSFLLKADNPGVGIPIKLQAQHRPMFPAGQLIGRATGEAIARWAAGADVAAKEPTVAASELNELLFAVELAATVGELDSLKPRATKLSKAHWPAVRAAMSARLGEIHKMEQADDTPPVDDREGELRTNTPAPYRRGR